MKLNRLNAALLLLLTCQAQAQSTDTLLAKQLAGAPEEFSAMRPANPADAAIHSKSALIPVQLSASKEGGFSWQNSLPMDSEKARVLLLSGADSDWELRFGANGTGDLGRAEVSAVTHTSTSFGMADAQVPAELFAFENLRAERYGFQVQSRSGSNAKGFLLLEGDAQNQLTSYQTSADQRLGKAIAITASLSNSAASNKFGSVERAKLTQALLRVTAPSGNESQAQFYDDGKHQDEKAGDGVYGATFVPSEVGNYRAQVQVEGNLNGVTVLRTAEHLVPVVDDQVQLLNARASLVNADSAGRLRIEVPVASNKAAQHYRSYAEFWGKDAAGNDVAVAWIGGMVAPKNGLLSMELDQRWIARAGANAPYSLRALRIEDPDHFITLAKADSLALVDSIAPISVSKSVQIDELMTMGPRPRVEKVQAKGVGSRLLLVHGYCSGGVWPVANFTNASTFLDANQNRSNDQFALLINSFGNTWNSYGIIAHSQGGMASLHLYTYYWSGLDNAVGSRLIQSVGTPYKGTNLAGVLAALGGIFGVGCGYNTDLTYSGAANWLAGIPTANRAKVNYHTTSFKLTNWWTNDYCNFASDLVLGDPEDGTTEQANGQLAGGINRGHVTGQCHTDGMRDPAQYRDAGRNSVMNSNAAR
jgi:hypothetical protein